VTRQTIAIFPNVAERRFKNAFAVREQRQLRHVRQHSRTEIGGPEGSKFCRTHRLVAASKFADSHPNEKHVIVSGADRELAALTCCPKTRQRVSLVVEPEADVLRIESVSEARSIGAAERAGLITVRPR
jgi:hypothetical protein